MLNARDLKETDMFSPGPPPLRRQLYGGSTSINTQTSHLLCATSSN